MNALIATVLSVSLACISARGSLAPEPDGETIAVTLCATGRTILIPLPGGETPSDAPHDAPMPCHATCTLRESEDDGPGTAPKAA